jgi:Tfp pilus assembly protein PilF
MSQRTKHISSKQHRRNLKMKLTAADYYERALTSSQEGDDKGAIADFTKAIKLDPQMAVAYLGNPAAHQD